MADLISREWVLKNLMFDVDREVVRKAPKEDAKTVRRYKLELICPTNGASCNECIPGAPCAIKKKGWEDAHADD